MTASERVDLQAQTTQLDERFRAATVDDMHGSLSRFFRIGTGWWWRRIPMRGSLREYLDHASRSD
ncbi:MAG TPA: hypothetical protein VF221_01400 [Chloroflexota bacterium]